MNKVLKSVALLFFLVLPYTLCAQVAKERRVYYLDCSYSMVQNGLWDKVRDNLKNAIDCVSDETTELLVIPFAFDGKSHSDLTPCSAYATDEGKQKLKKFIAGIKEPGRSTMTYHKDAIYDFIGKRINTDKVTYLFIMTDGGDEDKNREFDRIVKNDWSRRFGTENVFGFYVMLDKSANDLKREKLIKDAAHFWTVSTADVNINVIRMQSNAVFNARNEKYFELQLFGNYKGKQFNARFDAVSKYHVNKSEIVNGKLRVYVSFDGIASELPVSQIEHLSVTMSGGGEFDFFVTDVVSVKCESKPERSLKISVK